MIVTFLKFVFCVRDGHCDWWPRPSINVAISLLRCIRNVWHHLPNKNSVISQKIGILSHTAVRTPNLARLFHRDVSVSDLMTISCPSEVFGSLNESFKKWNTAYMYVRTECGDSESLRKLFWYCFRKKHTSAWQLHTRARSSQKSCLSAVLFVSFISVIPSYFCKLLVCFLFCLMVLQRL